MVYGEETTMKPQLLATGCHFPVPHWEKKRNPQRLFNEFYCGHSLRHVAVYKKSLPWTTRQQRACMLSHGCILRPSMGQTYSSYFSSMLVNSEWERAHYELIHSGGACEVIQKVKSACHVGMRT